MSTATMIEARRRLASVAPGNAFKILCHDRYWTPEFLQVYFRRCERKRFVEPEAVLALLEPAQKLVGLVARRGFSAEAERGWRMRFAALEGESAAWASDLATADRALEQGIHFMKSGPVPLVAAAEFFRRQGAAARLQGRPEAAEAWLSRAIEAYPHPKSPRPSNCGLAEALVLRGSLGEPAGFPGLAAVLTLLKPSRMKHSFEVVLIEGALWWLHQYLSDARLGPDQLGVVMDWLQVAYRGRFLRRTAYWSKTAIRHAEGRILQRLGIHRLAERRLKTALRWAERKALHGQVALCALDLAHSQLLDDRPEAAEKGLRARLETLAGQPELASLLERAARAGCPVAIEQARQECELHIPAMGYARFTPSQVPPSQVP